MHKIGVNYERQAYYKCVILIYCQAVSNVKKAQLIITRAIFSLLHLWRLANAMKV